MNHKKLAIVVEDNRIMREIIAKALVWDGAWDIVKAADGAEALASVGRPGVGLVIVDWKMVGMDGLECTRRIRSGANGNDPRLPVILVTAAGAELTDEMARAAGVDCLLRKPFTLIQLHSAIRQVTGDGVEPAV